MNFVYSAEIEERLLEYDNGKKDEILNGIRVDRRLEGTISSTEPHSNQPDTENLDDSGADALVCRMRDAIKGKGS